MGILNMLNKKKAEDQSVQPVVAEETPSAATAPPAAEQQPQPRPGGLSDEDYNHLLKFQTPEQISSSFNYKPGQSFLDIYTSTARKPQQVDEKRLKKAQLYSGIADSVSLLAQMFAAGKGAHVKERGFDQSATAQVNKRADQIRQLYKRDLDDYSKGYQGAAFKDITLALQQANAGRKEALSLLQNKQKAEAEAQKSAVLQQHREQQNTLARDKFEQQKEYQKATLEERKRNNKVSEGIRAANAQRRASGSSSSKDNFLYIPAREGDKDVVDVAGVSMSRYPATKEQIDDLASRAKLDKDFVNSDYYKQAIRNQVDEEEGSASPYALPGQKGSTSKPRYANNRQLAAYYVQYLREQQQFSGLETMPMHPPGMENGESNTTTKKKIGW